MGQRGVITGLVRNTRDALKFLMSALALSLGGVFPCQ